MYTSAKAFTVRTSYLSLEYAKNNLLSIFKHEFLSDQLPDLIAK